MEKVDDFDKEVTIYKVDLPGMGGDEHVHVHGAALIAWCRHDLLS